MKILGLEIKKAAKAEPNLDPLMERMAEIEPSLTDLKGKHATLAHFINVDFTSSGLKQLAAKGQWDEIARLMNKPFSELIVGKKVKAVDCEFTQQPRFKTEIK